MRVHYVYCGFISIIITSAPPPMIRHQIQDSGDPYSSLSFNVPSTLPCKRPIQTENSQSNLQSNMNFHIQMVTLTMHPRTESEPHDTHRRPEAGTSGLLLATAHCLAPTLCYVISCLQYFIHNLCLSLHAFLSLHTMFRLHLLLGIPSPSYCPPNSSLFQDSAGTSSPSGSPPGCLSGTILTFLMLSLPPCMHLIYTWPQHSAQCPAHIVKSKNNYIQMKCY